MTYVPSLSTLAGIARLSFNDNTLDPVKHIQRSFRHHRRMRTRRDFRNDLLGFNRVNAERIENNEEQFQEYVAGNHYAHQYMHNFNQYRREQARNLWETMGWDDEDYNTKRQISEELSDLMGTNRIFFMMRRFVNRLRFSQLWSDVQRLLKRPRLNYTV